EFEIAISEVDQASCCYRQWLRKSWSRKLPNRSTSGYPRSSPPARSDIVASSQIPPRRNRRGELNFNKDIRQAQNSLDCRSSRRLLFIDPVDPGTVHMIEVFDVSKPDRGAQ